MFVLTDHFTKHAEILAVANQPAEICASLLVNEFVERWGTPRRIHSDQGPTFDSKVFKELCQLLGVKKSRTSSKNPKRNGRTERFNRTLLRMTRAYLPVKQKDLDLHLRVSCNRLPCNAKPEGTRKGGEVSQP